MKHFFSCSIALALLLVLSACKKGQDDPEISFSSRKARLTGNWRIESGMASYTINKTYSEAYTFDNKGKYTLNKTSNGGPLTVYIGSYGLTLNISKDGKFVMNERYGTPLNAEGTWNFNTGVGKEKKKENVIFYIDKLTSGSLFQEHLFNRSSTTFIYKIKELRSKKMVITSSGKYFSDGQGDYMDFSSEFTFIQ